MLTALSLHGVRYAGPGIVGFNVVPEWYLGSSARHPIAMALGIDAGEGSLEEELFRQARRTARRLEDYDLADPKTPEELALRRFGMGCGRSGATDALVDFVIALEALLLPADRGAGTTELAFRFRTHGAYLIANSPEERDPTFDALKRVYDLRSRQTHDLASDHLRRHSFPVKR